MFDDFIMYCIMANTFVLAFQWYEQPESMKKYIELFNYVFVAIFTLEAVIKIIALRCIYFDDAWNRFDFFIVVSTAIVLVITWSGIGDSIEILFTIIRTLRICRVLRLIKK